MSPKRAKTSRKPRGAQKWILAELRSIDSGTTLSTSQIAKRIAKSSGRKYHMMSVYGALRILVGRGDIRAKRDGQEKAYWVQGASGGDSERSPRAAETSAMPTPPAPSSNKFQPTSPDLGVQASMLPHKLALGEILVLRIEGNQVLTATNVHGRVAIERHPLPG
jgi:hypothetical protein